METIQTIITRRSVNFFDPSFKISDNELTELLRLAALAPSSYNIQPWEVVVVRSPERKKALRECAFNQPKAEEASAVLIIIGNTDAVEENLDAVASDLVDKGYADAAAAESVKKTAGGFYGLPDSERRKVFSAKNAGLFAMNFMTAAEGLGYVTHPMDGFDEGKIKEAFGIKADKVVPMLIAVGRFKDGVSLPDRKMRFSPERFARFE
ncbi:nitroreductase family protein [Geovibrio thiophilus]|uniref:Nitroreductase family protein n=1 Tax=Geovibrio thiophilus TaxID=139438 RepID=A0A3R5UX61_9BACT|nr:nitroreductase family protein [Geovibrio thiophilus]QAR31987.1 nitroreductase family protein [Geovibrio thiophilus]